MNSLRNFSFNSTSNQTGCKSKLFKNSLKNDESWSKIHQSSLISVSSAVGNQSATEIHDKDAYDSAVAVWYVVSY